MPEDRIFEAIKQIYADSAKPLYLADLGAKLREDGHEFNKIKQLVSRMEGYTVVEHPAIPEKLAISTLAEKEWTYEQIVRSDVILDKENLKFLELLPRTFVLAFCSSISSSSYISLIRPYKFYPSQNEGLDLKEITAQDKIDLFLPKNLEFIKEPDKARKLREKIESWCARNDVAIEDIREEAKDNSIDILRKILPECIVLFIESQPEDVRKKIVIPLGMLKKNI